MPRASSRPENRRSRGCPSGPEFFKIAPKPRDAKLTILITGGSQGSRTLNEAARGSWSYFREARFPVRFIHQTGTAAYAVLAQKFAESGMEGEVAPFIDDMPGGVCARRPGDLPRGSGRGGGIGGRRQAVHPGSFAHRRRPASAAQCGSVPEGRGVGAGARSAKWMADGCLKKWRNCARIPNCYIAWESGRGRFAHPDAARTRGRMCWKKRSPVDIALESRNNTRLKCFLSRNTCTSPGSAALA